MAMTGRGSGSGGNSKTCGFRKHLDVQFGSKGLMGSGPAAASHLEHGSLRFSQLIKRRLSGRHLDDGATQRPDVCRLAVPSGTFVDDFRSHVLQRACTKRQNPLQP